MLLQKDKRFSVFHQPVSVQLKTAMENEEEKLLQRCLHYCWACNKEVVEQSKQSADKEKETSKKEEGDRNTKEEGPTTNTQKLPCSVIACAEMKKAKIETQHQIFDDTVRRSNSLLMLSFSLFLFMLSS